MVQRVKRRRTDVSIVRRGDPTVVRLQVECTATSEERSAVGEILRYASSLKHLKTGVKTVTI